jgi:hypothetical protein
VSRVSFRRSLRGPAAHASIRALVDSSVTPSDQHLPHLHLDHRFTLPHILSQTRHEVLHEPLALLFLSKFQVSKITSVGGPVR